MDLTPLFPSFLGTDMLDLDNDEILKAIRKAEKNSDGLSIHFNGDEPELQKLFGEAKLRFDALHSMFNLRDDVDNQIYRAWANIGPHHTTTEPHHHVEIGDALFCAVYYPLATQVGYPIVFMNPNLTQDAVVHDWVRDQSKPSSLYLSQQWRIQPQTGMLIVFPSWLYHYVMQEDRIPLEKDKRISLAFNSRFVKK